MTTFDSPLDNRDNCPADDICSLCPNDKRLRTATFDTQVGVVCATVCADCIVADRMPPLNVVAAAHAVLEHLGHVGIDLETAAELREAERRDRASLSVDIAFLPSAHRGDTASPRTSCADHVEPDLDCGFCRTVVLLNLLDPNHRDTDHDPRPQ